MRKRKREGERGREREREKERERERERGEGESEKYLAWGFFIINIKCKTVKSETSYRKVTLCCVE
jgi:hypothetical protein